MTTYGAPEQRRGAERACARRVVGLSGAALSLSLAGDASLYAILPARPQAAGVGLGAVGLLLSANRLVRLLLNPLAGLVYDRLGRRRPFIVALLLAALSTLLYAFLRGTVPLLAARVIWGAGWALVIVGAYSMLMDVATEENRGLLSGLLQVAYFVGVSLGLVGALLSDVLSFRVSMQVCAAITAIGFAAALGLPETRRSPGESTAAPRARVGLRALAPVYLLYALDYFCVNGVFSATLGRFLVDRWGASFSLGRIAIGAATMTGALLAVRSVLGLAGGPLGGRLSDRFGRWPVLAAFALLGGAGFGGVASGDLRLALAGGAALLLAVPAMNAILAALVGDLSDERSYGLSFGGLATAGDAGSAAGPLVAYGLLSAGVSLSAVYLACGAALLVAGGALAMRPPNRDL